MFPQDVPIEGQNEGARALTHQTSSKDADSESGPPSLSSSRGRLCDLSIGDDT